jgi:hypothetical protein
MEIPIAAAKEIERETKGVCQCRVEVVKMPRTMAALFKYEGHLQSIVDRASAGSRRGGSE